MEILECIHGYRMVTLGSVNSTPSCHVIPLLGALVFGVFGQAFGDSYLPLLGDSGDVD